LHFIIFQICFNHVLDYYAAEGYDLRRAVQGTDTSSHAGLADAVLLATHLRDHDSEYNGLVELLQQQLSEEKAKSKQLSQKVEELETALARRVALGAPQVLSNLDSD
jgi:hypothetical protein